ncbi:Lysophospholipid acyltransferase [Elasticomyces elasticus]|nr:Lysophospholipid acyltransferase [Elasticomyces elasticus]
MDITSVEFGQNGRDIFRSWNMRTQSWLYRCFYRRIGPQSNRAAPYKLFATFLLSGLLVSKILTFGSSSYPLTSRTARGKASGVWGVLAGLLQLVSKEMQDCTDTFIRRAGSKPWTNLLVKGSNWIISQGLMVLLIAPYMIVSDEEYMASFRVLAWFLPGLVVWILTLRLCRARINSTGKKLM